MVGSVYTTYNPSVLQKPFTATEIWAVLQNIVDEVVNCPILAFSFVTFNETFSIISLRRSVMEHFLSTQ